MQKNGSPYPSPLGYHPCSSLVYTRLQMSDHLILIESWSSLMPSHNRPSFMISFVSFLNSIWSNHPSGADEYHLERSVKYRHRVGKCLTQAAVSLPTVNITRIQHTYTTYKQRGSWKRRTLQHEWTWTIWTRKPRLGQEFQPATHFFHVQRPTQKSEMKILT